MCKELLIVILSCTVALFHSGCRDKEPVKLHDYSFEIRTSGMPGSTSFEAFLYNTDLHTYPPDRRTGITFEPNTLYILRHEYLDNERVTDTLTIELSGQQVDSLFNLAYKYVSDFEIDRESEIGKTHIIIQDGANIAVSLKCNGKAMECAEYRLKGISGASAGADGLTAFINRKSSEKFKLY